MHAEHIKELIKGANSAAELIIGSGSTGQWGPVDVEDMSLAAADEYNVIVGYGALTLEYLQKNTTDSTQVGPIENIHCILARRISRHTVAYLVCWN